jgi:hypothetical protein
MGFVVIMSRMLPMMHAKREVDIENACHTTIP